MASKRPASSNRRGKVRLLAPAELPADWDPATDPRLTAWEIVHHLIRALASGGEGAGAELVAKLGAKAEIARELAYRLYTLCERKKRATEALRITASCKAGQKLRDCAREGQAASRTDHDVRRWRKGLRWLAASSSLM
jgi:putative DNA methylase